MMNVIIAGSRGVSEQEVYAAVGACPWSGFITTVVSGGARGADAGGEKWAVDHSREIKRFEADWDSRGRAAGPIRNEEMARYSDGLIAIWDGESRGTGSMIGMARRYGLRGFIYRTDCALKEYIFEHGSLAGRWEWVEERAAILEFEGAFARDEAERIAASELRQVLDW